MQKIFPILVLLVWVCFKALKRMKTLLVNDNKAGEEISDEDIDSAEDKFPSSARVNSCFKARLEFVEI